MQNLHLFSVWICRIFNSITSGLVSPLRHSMEYNVGKVPRSTGFDYNCSTCCTWFGWFKIKQKAKSHFHRRKLTHKARWFKPIHVYIPGTIVTGQIMNKSPLWKINVVTICLTGGTEQPFFFFFSSHGFLTQARWDQPAKKPPTPNNFNANFVPNFVPKLVERLSHLLSWADKPDGIPPGGDGDHPVSKFVLLADNPHLNQGMNQESP